MQLDSNHDTALEQPSGYASRKTRGSESCARPRLTLRFPPSIGCAAQYASSNCFPRLPCSIIGMICEGRHLCVFCPPLEKNPYESLRFHSSSAGLFASRPYFHRLLSRSQCSQAEILRQRRKILCRRQVPRGGDSIFQRRSDR